MTDVRRATIADLPLVSAALASAFSDDPVIGWLIPPGTTRRDAKMLTFFTSMARSYLRRGKHVYVAGDGQGAALWSAPGSWTLPPSEMARETPSAVKAFGRNTFRAVRLQLQVESLHPKDPAHWYLGYLGTRSDAQGQGIGGAMLREVLSAADAAGVPAYLESSNERNLTLYRRHGFEVVEEIRALGRGPAIWRMWRNAKIIATSAR
jgi:ribosomal protein S18 acetylase RimI-like enzyme